MDQDEILLLGGVVLIALWFSSQIQPSTTVTAADKAGLLQAAGGNPILAANAQQQMQANINALATSDPQGAADNNCLDGNIFACLNFNTLDGNLFPIPAGSVPLQ